MYKNKHKKGDTERQFADKCLQQIEEVLMYEGTAQKIYTIFSFFIILFFLSMLGAHTVAAFMLETVTGTNGIIIPPG
jgi:hypothetical protein